MALLENRNIFLTGGSRGLGRDAVLELLRNGANVAFTYRTESEAAEATIALAGRLGFGGKVAAYQLDVKDPKDVESVAAKVLSAFGPLHVVVNNAGNLNDALVANMSDAQWHDVIDTHLTGTFNVCREFLGEFVYNKGGRFINTSSIAHTGSAGQANYSAAKAGIIGFSKALAKEWGKKNIYTNVICPGYYETDLTKANASPTVASNFVQLSSLKRAGQGSEYGSAVVFLASDLSSFVNGHVLDVSGGLETTPPI